MAAASAPLVSLSNVDVQCREPITHVTCMDRLSRPRSEKLRFRAPGKQGKLAKQTKTRWIQYESCLYVAERAECPWLVVSGEIEKAIWTGDQNGDQNEQVEVVEALRVHVRSLKTTKNNKKVHKKHKWLILLSLNKLKVHKKTNSKRTLSLLTQRKRIQKMTRKKYKKGKETNTKRPTNTKSTHYSRFHSWCKSTNELK